MITTQRELKLPSLYGTAYNFCLFHANTFSNLLIFSDVVSVYGYTNELNGRLTRAVEELGTIYSQVPNKQVGQNKRVGWLF